LIFDISTYGLNSIVREVDIPPKLCNGLGLLYLTVGDVALKQKNCTQVTVILGVQSYNMSCVFEFNCIVRPVYM